MGKALSRSASDAFSQGRYQEALGLYRQLSSLLGSKLFDANIKLCQKRIQSALPKRFFSPAALKQLKVAAVMDDFTFHSYDPECTLLQLTPDAVLSELESFKPDLLFIESAWRGKDELWNRKISNLSTELRAALEWCRSHAVPTVFWNKEDPVHFETFLTTAQQFDHVFTTDLDCIGRYKAALGHERVYLLPFACQPLESNPIERYERKDAFCFAGAYYVRHPERTRDLEDYVKTLPAFRTLEIFDRNFGKDDPNYQFPSEYSPYIVGTLPFKEIDKAYKGYRYSINLNSVKQSQTMFARRVYELLASNTLTVSNYSRGVRLMFGDLVITSDSGSEIIGRLQPFSDDEERAGKLRLAGLRKVMTEHTYRHRLAYLAQKALNASVDDALPDMLVIAVAIDDAAVRRLVSQFTKQTYTRRQLLLIVDGDGEFQPNTEPRVKIVRRTDFALAMLHGELEKSTWVAVWAADDHYGPNYLKDLAIATTFCDADVIGKTAHYAYGSENISFVDGSTAYRPAKAVEARRAAIRAARFLATVQSADDLFALMAITWRAGEASSILGIDPYNYCAHGATAPLSAQIDLRVDDLPLDTGLSTRELMEQAEQIPPTPELPRGASSVSAAQLAELLGAIRHAHVTFELRDDHLYVQSSLPDGKHEYFYVRADLRPIELDKAGPLKFHVEATPGINLQLMVAFHDDKGKKISHVVQPVNRNNSADVPPGSKFIRLALRVFGPGQAALKSLLWEHRRIEPPAILGRGHHLLLTNQYPSYDDLYRHGFVHTRVKAYLRHGERVDIFRLRDKASTTYHEFEDIDCITGSAQALDEMLSTGSYLSVLVHFLDPAMWEILRKHVDRVRVIVWIHGAEIQPFHRREYNYTNMSEDERSYARRQSEARLTFWQQLLRPMHPNVTLVFVSRYFAEEVMQDLGFRLPEGQYRAIHNPIDTELFSYVPKNPEQRRKILSIRPYASATYANDLSVKAILELSKNPGFEQLEFLLIGDGPLFETTVAPLRHLKNVRLARRFLRRNELAAIYRDYGIFLCPTRSDTHGVSRDEAMASGLVPVTSCVAAVPEFVDESCGFLSAPEDFRGLAAAIEHLSQSPDDFLKASAAAAERVRRQASSNLVVPLELEIFA